MGVFSVYQAQQAVTRLELNRLGAMADASAKLIAAWFDARRDEIRLLARLDAFAERQLDAVNASLKALSDLNGHYDTIYLVGLDGAGMAGVRRDAQQRRTEMFGQWEAAGFNVADHEWFRQAVAGQEVVSGVLRSKATRSRVVVIASPVYRDGAVGGVVCGAILTDSLLDRIRGLQLHDGIEAYLVDGEGKAATPARSVSSLDAPVETEGVAALLRRENGTGRYANAAGVLVLGVYRYLPEIGWGFVLELDETHALAAVNDLVRRLVTWLGIGALATLALAAADEVSGATEEMAASNEEVAEAGKALAAMARRLEEWVRRFRM